MNNTLSNPLASDTATAPQETGFAALGISSQLQNTLVQAGYTQPTPIQQQAIPHILNGNDLLGCAQTGTGKTAAFALPILQNLSAEPTSGKYRDPRALVLAPTRELAAQIAASFAKYGGRNGPRHAGVFGGVSKHGQIAALRRGVDVLVATPGRLLDLMNCRAVRLDHIQIFVLDEADRMLDMGFIHDVRRIEQAMPKQRQTLMFSATMPTEIMNLANSIQIKPMRVDADPVGSTREPISQSVYFVDRNQKTSLLLHLLEGHEVDRALVFTRTKHAANRLAQKLFSTGIKAEAIHGNKSQAARERTLSQFRAGALRVVVATDVAARGIDIKDLSHVVNFDVPTEAESYVHRIGRTGRAGASGIAVTFCSRDERGFLRDIERLTRRRLDEAQAPQGLERTENAPRGPAPRQGSRFSSERSPRAARPQGSAPRSPREGARHFGSRRGGRRSERAPL